MNIPKVKRPSDKILAQIHLLNSEKEKIAVIEPDTSVYFFGETLLEAFKEARKQFPAGLFYSIRIGSPFADKHKGEIARI